MKVRGTIFFAIFYEPAVNRHNLRRRVCTPGVLGKRWPRISDLALGQRQPVGALVLAHMKTRIATNANEATKNSAAGDSIVLCAWKPSDIIELRDCATGRSL